jgi:hypothetical protein
VSGPCALAYCQSSPCSYTDGEKIWGLVAVRSNEDAKAMTKMITDIPSRCGSRRGCLPSTDNCFSQQSGLEKQARAQGSRSPATKVGKARPGWVGSPVRLRFVCRQWRDETP